MLKEKKKMEKMEEALSANITAFRQDKAFKTRFNVKAINAFKSYADWFLKVSLPFQNADAPGMNDVWFQSRMISLLKQDMMENILNDNYYVTENKCYYFYLMAYFTLNLDAYQKEKEILYALFSIGGFEQEALSGNWILPLKDITYRPLLKCLKNKGVSNILNNTNIADMIKNM